LAEDAVHTLRYVAFDFGKFYSGHAYYSTRKDLIVIQVRIIYRLNEFAKPGGNATLVDHEVWMYVLDASLMAICLILWNAFHPGPVFVGQDAEYPPKPPGYFRRFCCCCFPQNRRGSWERIQERKRAKQTLDPEEFRESSIPLRQGSPLPGGGNGQYSRPTMPSRDKVSSGTYQDGYTGYNNNSLYPQARMADF